MRQHGSILLAAGLGGALGSALRVLVAWWVYPASEALGFPLASTLVNILGAFLIGLLTAAGQPDGRWAMSAPVQAFWLAGFCGGLTTFSFVGLESLLLMLDRAWWLLAGYWLVSLVGWLLAVSLGYRLGQKLS